MRALWVRNKEAEHRFISLCGLYFSSGLYVVLLLTSQKMTELKKIQTRCISFIPHNKESK